MEAEQDNTVSSSGAVEAEQEKTIGSVDEQFWLHKNITYSSGIDEHGNYFFELINYKSGKIYWEYLSPMHLSAIEMDNAQCLLHLHLHK